MIFRTVINHPEPAINASQSEMFVRKRRGPWSYVITKRRTVIIHIYILHLVELLFIFQLSLSCASDKAV